MHRSIDDASYSRYVPFWDGLHGDRTDEVRFWAELAGRYGKRVLSPLAATGEIAVALARRGFEVLALDCCPSMVSAAQRKGESVPSFNCRKGTIADLPRGVDPFDFVFFAGGDYNHYYDEVGQLTVLEAVHGVLRPGGAFALEMMPFDAARPACATTSRKAYHPGDGTPLRVHAEASYARDSRMLSIEQTMLIGSEEAVEEQHFRIPLRVFTGVELISSLAQTGFRRSAEFGNYDLQPHAPGSPKWIVLAEKRHGS